jgi:hypothetical protein
MQYTQPVKLATKNLSEITITLYPRRQVSFRCESVTLGFIAVTMSQHEVVPKSKLVGTPRNEVVHLRLSPHVTVAIETTTLLESLKQGSG